MDGGWKFFVGEIMSVCRHLQHLFRNTFSDHLVISKIKVETKLTAYVKANLVHDVFDSFVRTAQTVVAF